MCIPRQDSQKEPGNAWSITGLSSFLEAPLGNGAAHCGSFCFSSTSTAAPRVFRTKFQPAALGCGVPRVQGLSPPVPESLQEWPGLPGREGRAKNPVFLGPPQPTAALLTCSPGREEHWGAAAPKIASPLMRRPEEGRKRAALALAENRRAPPSSSSLLPEVNCQCLQGGKPPLHPPRKKVKRVKSKS